MTTLMTENTGVAASHDALQRIEEERDNREGLTLVGRQYWKPNAGQAAQIAEMVRVLVEYGITDAEIGRSAAGRHSANLGKILSGTYGYRAGKPPTDGSPLLADFYKAFKTVLMRKQLERQGALPFYPTQKFAHLESQVTIAQGATALSAGERLVLVVGESAMGKTAAIQELVLRRSDCVIINGSELWGSCYKAALRDLCTAMELSLRNKGKKGKPGKERTASELRDDLLAHLAVKRRVLVFDRVTPLCLSEHVASLIGTILGTTLTTIVLAATPRCLEAMRGLGLSRAEMNWNRDAMGDFYRELVLRCRCVEFNSIEFGMAHAVISGVLGSAEGLGTVEKPSEALRQVVQAANQAGGYFLVNFVALSLARLQGQGGLSIATAVPQVLSHYGVRLGLTRNVAKMLPPPRKRAA